MKVILYSTGCPKCHILETKLNKSNIHYDVVNDVDVMTEKGFMSSPMLEVDGETMDFGAAVRWANGLEDKN